MFKKILAAFAAFSAAAAFAAVDVNTATAADLDSVKEIGPATSKRIISERKKGEFKDWSDFIKRVRGVGEKSAARLSENGLTVNGATYAAAPAKAVAGPAGAASMPAAGNRPVTGPAGATAGAGTPPAAIRTQAGASASVPATMPAAGNKPIAPARP